MPLEVLAMQLCALQACEALRGFLKLICENLPVDHLPSAIYLDFCP